MTTTEEHPAGVTAQEVRARPERAALLVALLVGAALRVWWSIYAHPRPVSDFGEYYKLALSIRHWNFASLPHGPNDLFAYRSPGYPAVLSAAMLPSTSLPWTRLMNVAMSTAVVPLVYCVSLRLRLGPLTAAFAAFIAALYPAFVFFSPVVASEHLQVLLLLAMMLVLLSDLRQRAVLGGLLLGAAALVRPESPFYLLAVPPLLYSAPPSTTKVWKEVLVVAVSMLIFVTPWVVRNQVVAGNGALLSSRSGDNFYFAHRPNGYGQDESLFAGEDRVAESRAGLHKALSFLSHHPASLFGDIRQGTRQLFAEPTYAVAYGSADKAANWRPASAATSKLTRATWIALFALAIAGAVLLMFRQRRALAVLAAFIVANWLCFAVVFWAKSRYGYAIDPLVCILAATACAAALERIGAVGRSVVTSGSDARRSTS